jgi:tetratricopeptide (TPR) repeat protein
VLLLVGIYLTFLGPSTKAIRPSSVYVAQANSITGYVFDDQRNGIPDMQVELLTDVDSVIQRTKTDSSGLYGFRRLTTGVFQVRIQTYGTNYIGQTQRVQLERRDAFEQVDFMLSAKRSTSTSATPGAIFVQEVPQQARKEFERGVMLLRKNDQRAEALEKIQLAIELFPSYYEALELLGNEYVKDGKYNEAVPVLTKALEVNKRAYHSLYALSVAQYNLKLLPEAVDQMRRAITLNQSSINANLWLGMLLRYSSKLDEAETYLKQADHLASSKSADAHWQLALLYDKLKRHKEAADHLEMFLKVQPDSKDAESIKKLIQRFRQQAASRN